MSMTFIRHLLTSILLLSAIACLAEEAEPKTAFLRERKVITTKTGVSEIAAGTRVVVTGRHGDMLTVKVNDQEFEIAQDQVTTDAEAGHALLQEQRQQELLEKQATEEEIRYKEALLRRQKEEEESARAKKTAGAKPPDRELEEIRKKRDQLTIELDKIKLEQKDLPAANSRDQSQEKAAPNSLQLQERRQEVERELTELKQRERSLKSKSR